MSDKEIHSAFPVISIKESKAKTEILINGIHIEKWVSNYSVVHESGEVPILRLDIPAINMDLEGEMFPQLPDILKSYYE